MTHPRPRRRARVHLLVVCVGLALLAACTGAPHSAEGPGSSHGASPTTTASPSAQAVATATRQAAQYDYDAAIQALSGFTDDDANQARQQIEAAKAQAVQWPDNTTIPHIFYHSLIIDPQRAFASPDGQGYNEYMVTQAEFAKQLDQIYANGWVLIHPQRIAAPGPDGVMTPTPILLPPGKKPFVLSIDDVSYYEYMTGDGFADKLIVNKAGKVVNTYTDAAGKTTEGSYDVIPMVDDFIAAHPDFSYRGDKGTIALTGYNGILGYRSSAKSYGDTPATQAEQAAAKTVADALKAEGWNFASHTWGHINLTKSSLGMITADAKRWDAEVRPLIGDTPILIYPFGADISGVQPYGPNNAKFAFLHDQEKFSYFCNVDASQPHWMQIGPQSVRQARINVDGITLQKSLNGKTHVLDAFFDPATTVDPHRPLPVPGT